MSTPWSICSCGARPQAGLRDAARADGDAARPWPRGDVGGRPSARASSRRRPLRCSGHGEIFRTHFGPGGSARSRSTATAAGSWSGVVDAGRAPINPWLSTISGTRSRGCRPRTTARGERLRLARGVLPGHVWRRRARPEDGLVLRALPLQLFHSWRPLSEEHFGAFDVPLIQNGRAVDAALEEIEGPRAARVFSSNLLRCAPATPARTPRRRALREPQRRRRRCRSRRRDALHPRPGSSPTPRLRDEDEGPVSRRGSGAAAGGEIRRQQILKWGGHANELNRGQDLLFLLLVLGRRDGP